MKRARTPGRAPACRQEGCSCPTLHHMYHRDICVMATRAFTTVTGWRICTAATW